MVTIGLVIAGISFALGSLVVMADMNHPTGASGEGVLGFAAVGIVVGILIAFVGLFV